MDQMLGIDKDAKERIFKELTRKTEEYKVVLKQLNTLTKRIERVSAEVDFSGLEDKIDFLQIKA